METYSNNATVKLYKTVVGKTGNIYYPGIYSPANPLPERFLNSEYVKLISQPEFEKEQEKVVVFGEEKEQSEIKVENSVVSGTKVLNINQATKVQIVALSGVGQKTADKVIELRELYPFSDYKDLNERAPLTFGRDWKEFNLEF